jgi:hypothetical protein
VLHPSGASRRRHLHGRHNDHVLRRSALPALVAVAALMLTGCGGGGSSSEPASGGSGSSTSSDTSSDGGSIPSSVDGVQLTPQGARLKLGDTARVSWQPDQQTTGVIAVTVTGLLKMPISAFRAWRLKPETQRSTPYFVHATVRNLGDSNLSNVPVPLYLLDERETLMKSSTFQAKFGSGDKASVCLVYFVPHHGKLVAISFRPTEDFDAITWEGQVVDAGARHHKKKH